MKADFLKECMSEMGMIPINDFNKSYCARCINQSCARSSSNNHLFVQRASNWENKLFLNVARADEHDNKYDGIRSKLFIPSNQGGTVVSTLDDVQDEEPQIEPDFTPIVNVVEEPEIVEVPTPDVPVLNTPSIQTPEYAGVKNTPFQQGIMLNIPEEKIVPLGGTIVLDDD